MSKVKISELAKSFNVAGKDIIAELKTLGIEKKSAANVLDETELNLLLELLTRKTDDGSEIDISDYTAH